MSIPRRGPVHVIPGALTQATAHVAGLDVQVGEIGGPTHVMVQDLGSGEETVTALEIGTHVIELGVKPKEPRFRVEGSSGFRVNERAALKLVLLNVAAGTLNVNDALEILEG